MIVRQSQNEVSVYFGGGYAVGFHCILRDRFGPSKRLKEHWLLVVCGARCSILFSDLENTGLFVVKSFVYLSEVHKLKCS